MVYQTVTDLGCLIAQREREIHALDSLIAQQELITSQLKEITHDHMNSIEANSRSFALLKRSISGVEKKLRKAKDLKGLLVSDLLS
jgi:hypothetical protein